MELIINLLQDQIAEALNDKDLSKANSLSSILLTMQTTRKEATEANLMALELKVREAQAGELLNK